MATLTPTKVPITGLALNLTAADVAGDRFQGSDRMWLTVDNASAAAITVTVVVPGDRFAQPNPDVPVTVPAGGRVEIGGLGERDLADVEGFVSVTYSAVTGVTRQLRRL